MKNNIKYSIRIFEAQWDHTHDASIKPLFQLLKNETECDGHNVISRYFVFQDAESLRSAINYCKKDPESNGMTKVGYFATHGLKDRIQALSEISRVKFKNMLVDTNYSGIYMGSCDFGNRATAELLLNSIPTLKWFAGYEKWVPFIESSMLDTMWFKLLLDGKFVRPTSRARWEKISGPVEVAKIIYDVFPMAKDMRFSLFYKDKSGNIKSSLEDKMN